jgi:hypothetical protein
VWSDNRSGEPVIYGARVTPQGTVLDPSSFVVSQATYSQWYPALGFDGANFLVVWQDYRSGSYDIYGARVAPQGTVLDPEGFVISQAADWQWFPALGFDGANFLVVWEDWRGSDSDIYGARVTPAGTVLDPEGFVISQAADGQLSPALAYDGTNFLAAWEDYRGSGLDIYGARVSPGGVVFDSGPVVRQEGGQNRPKLARGAGSQLFLVYEGWVGTVGDKSYNTQRIWGKMDPSTGVGGTPIFEVRTARVEPTIVRGVLRLPISPLAIHTSLFDMTGRAVMSLRPGANDVSRLSPGVYFVRERRAQAQAQAVRKVVIAR